METPVSGIFVPAATLPWAVPAAALNGSERGKATGQAAAARAQNKGGIVLP